MRLTVRTLMVLIGLLAVMMLLARLVYLAREAARDGDCRGQLTHLPPQDLDALKTIGLAGIHPAERCRVAERAQAVVRPGRFQRSSLHAWKSATFSARTARLRSRRPACSSFQQPPAIQLKPEKASTSNRVRRKRPLRRWTIFRRKFEGWITSKKNGTENICQPAAFEKRPPPGRIRPSPIHKAAAGAAPRRARGGPRPGYTPDRRSLPRPAGRSWRHRQLRRPARNGWNFNAYAPHTRGPAPGPRVPGVPAGAPHTGVSSLDATAPPPSTAR